MCARWHGRTEPSGLDHDVALRPAVHARRRRIGVVVGQDEEDLHLARAGARARPARRHRARVELLARRQERVAVRERPAEVLRVGELEPVGADALRERDDLRDLVEVLRGAAPTFMVSGSPSSFTQRIDVELVLERREARDAVR